MDREQQPIRVGFGQYKYKFSKIENDSMSTNGAQTVI